MSGFTDTFAAPPVAPEPVLGGRVELILSVIGNDWRRALAAGAIVAAGAAAIACAVPVRYVAHAELLVLPAAIYAPDQDAGGTTSPPTLLDRDTYLKDETALLTSRSLAEDVIRTVGLARLYPADAAAAARGRPGDPVARAATAFAHDFYVDADKTGNVISLSFRARDAALAADTVRTAVALYDERRRALFVEREAQPLERETDNAAAALRAAELDLNAYRSAHGIADDDADRHLLLDSRDDVRRNLRDAHQIGAEDASRLDALTTAVGAAPSTVTLFADSDRQSEIGNLKTGLENLRIREAGLVAREEGASPELLSVRAQIAASQDALARLGPGSVTTSSRQGRNPLLDELATEEVHAREDLDAATARAATANTELAALDRDIRSLVAAEPDLRLLTHRRDAALARFDATAAALDARHILDAVAAARADNIRVLQPAEIPTRPDRLLPLIAAAGLLLALFAVVATLVLSEVFRRGFLTAARVEHALGLAVLATIREHAAPHRGADGLTLLAQPLGSKPLLSEP